MKQPKQEDQINMIAKIVGLVLLNANDQGVIVKLQNCILINCGDSSAIISPYPNGDPAAKYLLIESANTRKVLTLNSHTKLDTLLVELSEIIGLTRSPDIGCDITNQAKGEVVTQLLKTTKQRGS